MSRAKELLERIYRERDFFGGMEHRITQAADEDAKDFVDYEAAVEALERLAEQHHALSEHNPGSVFQMRPAFEGLPECDDYTCVTARAALARLRDEVPA